MLSQNNKKFEDWTLLLLAAGRGKRFGGLKQIYRFGPQQATLAEFAIWDAWQCGCKHFVAVVNTDTQAKFTHLFERMNLAHCSQCVLQDLLDIPTKELATNRQKPWGTGHALWTARKVIHTPFVLVNADDFYGPHAYKLAANFFQQDKENYGLVTYRLGETLSKNGSVSRGLCQTDSEGRIIQIQESPKIQQIENSDIIDAGGQRLEFDTPVSMNFWLLQPSIFDPLESLLTQFLAQMKAPQGEEFYLPKAVYETSRNLSIGIVDLPNLQDRWYGVTYAEDIAAVNEHLALLTSSGIYPKTCLHA